MEPILDKLIRIMQEKLKKAQDWLHYNQYTIKNTPRKVVENIKSGVPITKEAIDRSKNMQNIFKKVTK